MQYFKTSIHMFTNGKNFHISGKKKKKNADLLGPKVHY